MVYGAIDLHMRYSQIRVVDAEGRVVRERRVVTSADRLIAAFAGLGSIRIVLESATESEWVAQALENAGYEVVVADPNYAPMYGEVRRRIKTDRRDVAALAEANRRGWYRRAYRRSAAQRELQQILATRRQLVQMRSGTIAQLRALLRQRGYRLPTGASVTVPARTAALPLPPALRTTIDVLARTIARLSEELGGIDARLQVLTRPDDVVQRLQSVPGVGLIVAASFRAFIDDIGRFARASQVSAALGLVPREASSAERRHRGAITKVGPCALRSLLVQAAWACWRSRGSLALRGWVNALAARRGRRVAVVALARRLSRILFALWRDQTTFHSAALVAA